VRLAGRNKYKQTSFARLLSSVACTGRPTNRLKRQGVSSSSGFKINLMWSMFYSGVPVVQMVRVVSPSLLCSPQRVFFTLNSMVKTIQCHPGK
jgi:hypothetical protein